MKPGLKARAYVLFGVYMMDRHPEFVLSNATPARLRAWAASMDVIGQAPDDDPVVTRYRREVAREFAARVRAEMARRGLT